MEAVKTAVQKLFTTLKFNISGPTCSKLRMPLVNVSLNLLSLNMAYTLIFLLKKM